MVLSSLHSTTGKSMPIPAVPVELNDNLPGVVFEVHHTGRVHGTSTPAIG